MSLQGHRMRRSLVADWRAASAVERVGYAVGAALFASGVAHLGVFAVDGGPWEGPVSWRKPVTFGLSFGITLITLVWVGSRITAAPRARSAILGAFTAACVVEVGLTTLQAWRGAPSHLNRETPFDSAVSTALSAGGVLLVVLVVALAVLSSREGAVEDPAMRLAVRSGLWMLVAAVAVGGAMIARGVLAGVEGGPGAAYAAADAFKPVHAVAMHAVLVLPALAWALGFTLWTRLLRLRVVQLGAAGYAVVSVVVGVESFAGVSPLSAPPAATALAVLGLLALGLAVAVAVFGVVRFPAREPQRTSTVPGPGDSA